jgi:2-(1,2-epoxy-1,2-dihydrophenyl)acetyl-CoA isomerase
MGPVNYVVDPGERETFTEQLAGRLLAAPRVTLVNVKRLVRRAPHTELASHLELEIEAYARACDTPDFPEGVAAFLEKRRPVFGQKS